MSFDKVLDVFAAMVTVGLVSVILQRAGGAAQLLKALGDLFSGALRTAMDN